MIIRTPRPGLRATWPTRAPAVLAAAAVAAGAIAWTYYFQERLVLSHYDAKAHLVVARRVIDNITPGWQQIGAVWLPLPHLIHVFPVQSDFLYRTGVFGSLVSLACFGATVWAAARLVLLTTGSQVGAGVAAALLVLNPDVLYLQVTPMTEPLLLAASFLSVLWLSEWLLQDTDEVPARLGWTLFAAAWTRYEAWAILSACLAGAAFVMWRRGLPPHTIVARTWRLARWPAAAALIFVVNSRITVGAWFVSGGFFVPDPEYAGRLWRSLVGVWWGTHQLSGYVSESVALLTAGVLIARALASGANAPLMLPVALLASAALPFVAFYEGHPYRIRYMVPVVAACALLCGMAVGVVEGWRRNRRASSAARRGLASYGLALALLASALIESPPWEEQTPLLSEAQWDVPASLNRRAVTRCLAGGYRGEKILASMGSLAHYMQELSHEGFDIADFIHEGTGAIWELALETGPVPHAAWMLVEEAAEGGDVLAQRMRQEPAFARGMRRTCEGGGVALYRAE